MPTTYASLNEKAPVGDAVEDEPVIAGPNEPVDPVMRQFWKREAALRLAHECTKPDTTTVEVLARARAYLAFLEE